MSTICLFNTTKAWGGGEKWHLDTACYLIAHGHEVLVFAHRKGNLMKRSETSGVDTCGIVAGNLSFLNPFKILTLSRKFRRLQIKVLVMNLSRDVKLAGIAAKIAGIPRIIYRRGSDIPIRNTWLNRMLFKHILTEVLANSEATKNSILSTNNNLIPESRITVIYNGLDLEKFPPPTPEEHKKEASKLILLTLGRLEKQKNQEFLIQLGSELEQRGLDFELHIGGSGRLEEQLRKNIEDRGLEEHIFLDGFISDVRTYMLKADIFLLSSLWEGFGYVLAEAQLCEKPVIAFDVSSNSEVVTHEKSGLLTPVNEVAPFADAVQRLSENAELRTAYGKYGRSDCVKRFDKEKNLKKVEEYLRYD